MNLKRLMFLKASGGQAVKGDPPAYFSATTSGKNKTNDYGTTIDTTSAEGNKVVVTQVYDPGYDPSSYRNGFFVIGFSKVDEWVAAGKDITFDADVVIAENPASASSTKILLKNKQVWIDFASGHLHAKFTGLTSSGQSHLEFYCAGCSFALSNCKLSIE
jgi:hypothetical protein